MSVLLNGIICLGSIYSIIIGIKDGNNNLLFYSTMVFCISLINTISIIKKNKHIYKLENNYFTLINLLENICEKKDYVKLESILKLLVRDNWYKNMKIERSDFPDLEAIRQFHE